MRIHLTGELLVENGERLLRENELPGRQGRLVLAILASEHSRVVDRDEVIDLLWSDQTPATADRTLQAVISRLRSCLEPVGLGDALRSLSGALQLQLPPGWDVDLDIASDALDRAERSLRDFDAAGAMGWALVTRSIVSHPFLPGESAEWIERQRSRLTAQRVRALSCCAAAQLQSGQPQAAEADAERVLALDPFNEPDFRLIMRARIGQGDRAGALATYERLRVLVRDQLGADPSTESQHLHTQLLA